MSTVTQKGVLASAVLNSLQQPPKKRHPAKQVKKKTPQNKTSQKIQKSGLGWNWEEILTQSSKAGNQ